MTTNLPPANKKTGNLISNPFEALERIETTLIRIENETLPDLLKRLYKLTPELNQGNEKLISKKDAARLLGCSVSTIDNLRRRGKLQSIKVGKAARFRLGDLNEIIGRTEL